MGPEIKYYILLRLTHSAICHEFQITKEVPKELRVNRAKIRQGANIAKQNGHRFIASLDYVIIDDIEYNLSNIDTIQLSVFRFNYKILLKLLLANFFLLNKIRNYITELTAGQIDKTLILPYFDYGDIIYYNLSNKMSNKMSDKLETSQNRALKICTKSRNKTPMVILNRSTNTVPLEKRRLTQVREKKVGFIDSMSKR